MKSLKLQGFPNVTIFNDGTATDENGKQIKITKAGKIKITCTEDVEDTFVSGRQYEFAMSDLQEYPEEHWSEVTGDNMPDANAENAEKTEDEKAKEAHKAKLKELRDAINDAQKQLLTVESGDLEAARDRYLAAQAAYDEYQKEASTINLTDEQKAEIEKFEAIVAYRQSIKDEFDAATEQYKAQAEIVKGYHKVRGTSSTGTGEFPQRAAGKLNYEKAQEIRKKSSEGAKVSDLATEYGVTAASINYVLIYEHYKLKAGDTAWIPVPENA